MDEYVVDVLFEWVDEVGRMVSVVVDVGEFVVGDRGELGSVEELVMDGVNELDGCGGWDEIVGVGRDVVGVEEGVDDGGRGG